MPHLKLTETAVAKITPDGLDYHDTDLTGFHVRAGKRGLVYRVRVTVGRKVKVCTLGSIDGMNVDQARRKARVEIGRLLAEAPTTPKQTKGAELTFEAALNAYLVRCEQQERSQVTIKGYRVVAERHLSDWFSTPLIELGQDRPKVEDRFHLITRRNGGPSANSAMRVFRAVYNHAMKRHPILPVNPSIVIEWNREAPKKAAYSPDELPTVINELLSHDNATRAHLHLLCWLTGCRSGALKSATWADYDSEAQTLYLPSHKGRAFTVRLSSALVSLLDTRNQIVGQKSSFIFPARTKSGHVEDARIAVQQSTKLAEYRKTKAQKESDKIGTHIWRDTYISLARAAGVSRDDTKRLVDHSIQQDAHAGYESDDAAHAYLVTQQEKMSEYLLEHANLGPNYLFTREELDAFQLV